jgi:hypothetical protein
MQHGEGRERERERERERGQRHTGATEKSQLLVCCATDPKIYENRKAK